MPASPQPRLPDAVLWDMDGTLVDTEPLWNEAQRELVADHGGTWTQQLAESLVGQALDVGARRLQAAGVDLPVERIIDVTISHVIQAVRRAVPWRPGALELLQDQAAAGVPGALVTMSHAPLARVLAEHAPAGSLRIVVSGDEVTRGKPDPEAYRLGLSRLRQLRPDLSPQRCAAVEDSPVGVAAATAAGLPTAAVPSVLALDPDAGTVQWDTLAGRGLADLADVVAAHGSMATPPRRDPRTGDGAR